jgi:DNA mismatch repair protein MSH6
LEVVESAAGTVKGTLLHYVDHCKTQFGKRQLKRWLMAPLMNVDRINARLDAIEDMMTFQHETDVLRARLQKLPDLEKLLAKIFTYSI